MGEDKGVQYLVLSEYGEIVDIYKSYENAKEGIRCNARNLLEEECKIYTIMLKATAQVGSTIKIQEA